jgi:hypothetical protein
MRLLMIARLRAPKVYKVDLRDRKCPCNLANKEKRTNFGCPAFAFCSTRSCCPMAAKLIEMAKIEVSQRGHQLNSEKL